MSSSLEPQTANLQTGPLACESKSAPGLFAQPSTTPVSEVCASEASDGGVGYDLVATLRGHKDMVSSLAFGAGTQDLISGSHDKSVRLWNWQSNESSQLLVSEFDLVRSLAVAARANLLAIGKCEVGVHSLSDGHCVERSPIDIGIVSSVVITPDGSILVAGGSDGTVALWHVSPLERYPMGSSQLLSGHENPVRSVTIGLSNTLLATASEADGTVNLWSLPDGRRLSTFRIERFNVPVLAMSGEGVLAIGRADAGDIRLCRVSRGGQIEMLGDLSGHSQGVLALSIDASSRFAVSGGKDKTTRVWNLVSKAPLFTLTGHSARVTAVAISDGGVVVASGSNDGSICIWRRS